MKVTKQDEQALRAALRRKPRKIHELRAFLCGRLKKRTPSKQPWWHRESASLRNQAECIAHNAVARLLGEWKRQGLIDNPVRGTWRWVGK